MTLVFTQSKNDQPTEGSEQMSDTIGPMIWQDLLWLLCLQGTMVEKIQAGDPLETIVAFQVTDSGGLSQDGSRGGGKK